MLFRASFVSLSALLLLSSCANSSPPAATAAQLEQPTTTATQVPVSTLEEAGPHKPSAPLILNINAERTAPNASTYRVLLMANPTGELSDLALSIDGHDQFIGTVAKAPSTPTPPSLISTANRAATSSAPHAC
jgi:hypothetical protein